MQTGGGVYINGVYHECEKGMVFLESFMMHVYFKDEKPNEYVLEFFMEDLIKTDHRLMERYLKLVSKNTFVGYIEEEDLFEVMLLHQMYKSVVEQLNTTTFDDEFEYCLFDREFYANLICSKISRSFSMEKCNEEKTLSTDLIHSFFLLLHTSCLYGKSVSWYADALNVSENSLNLQVKEQTGKSVKEWIDLHIINASKARLRTTLLPIKNISLELGCDDPGVFVKFFKRHVGCTPTEYRKKFM